MTHRKIRIAMTRNECRRCFGTGERIEMGVESFQVVVRLIPCRCLEGVMQ